MIGYIKGKILAITPEYALIETAGGLGFEVICTYSAFASFAGKSEGGLYTYLYSNDNGVALYGFSSMDEKSMFLKLISVSGVGPKMGVALLSGLNVADLAVAIASADVKRLSAIKGIGKKLAEKIIVELREKVGAPATGDASAVLAPAAGNGDEDALVALTSMGFTRAESEKAIARARSQGASTAEEVVLLALKGM